MAGRDKPEQPEPVGPVLTGKLWNRLRHNGRLVRDEVTGHLPPIMRGLAWEQFKRMPLAQSACTLVVILCISTSLNDCAGTRLH